MLKFPEMPYERPDVEAAKQFLADAAARLDAAESFEAADAVFVEVDKYTTCLLYTSCCRRAAGCPGRPPWG